MGQPVRLLADYLPEGFLQPRGEEVPWHKRGGGHPKRIAIQITNRTKTVKTKTGRRRDVPVVERFTLTDDLDGVMERVIDSNRKNESVFCAPVSFFGKSRVAESAGSCTPLRSTSTASACRN